MNATEYFLAAQDAAEDMERARQMLAKLKSGEVPKGIDYERFGAGGGDHDAMAVTDARIDFEATLSERIGKDRAIVDDALEVLYGKDGHGGIAKLKGNRFADAVCMRYLQLEKWTDIAEVMSCTVKWCRSLCNDTFRFIDDVGFAYVREA